MLSSTTTLKRKSTARTRPTTQVKRQRKTCHQQGCVKLAQGATNYCKAHGGGKRCSTGGCTKSAQGATDYCKRHGGGKRCLGKGCKNSAAGSTEYCSGHGGGKRCATKGCNKSAVGATDCCKRHGGGKRCAVEGCKNSARGATDYCSGHGGGKRCATEGCKNSAVEATNYCKGHGGGTRCATEGCVKSARGGTDYCVNHGGGKRCATEGCEKSAQGASDYCCKHGGGTQCALCAQFSVPRRGFLCWTCRQGTSRLEQFEACVENFLLQHQTLRNFTYRDESLPCAPNRRRPDFTYVLPDRVVVLEVDEQEHRYYNKTCECVRVLELHEQAQGKALFVVRFNPLQRLLPELAEALQECFAAPLPDNLLAVRFLGYSAEYDVVAEVVKLSSERSATPKTLRPDSRLFPCCTFF